MIRTAWLYRIMFLTALLPTTVTRAMAPMGTGEKTDIMICTMMELTDTGPRSPCVVAWYQLQPDGTVLDYRTVYRTDDYITGLTVGDLNGNGEHELILAVRSQRTGSSSIMVAAMDRMGTPREKLRALTPSQDLPYAGLAFGDFDVDGTPDLLTLRSGPENSSELILLSFDSAGKVVDSHALPCERLSDAQAVAFTTSFRYRKADVFVAVSGRKGSEILRMTYTPSPDGFQLRDQRSIATIDASMGAVHGLTVIKHKGRPTLLAATRKVDAEPQDDGASAEMEHKGVFIAPLVTEETSGEDKSHFILIPLGRATRTPSPRTVDDLRLGRAWASSMSQMPTLPPASAPSALSRPRPINSPLKVLYIAGLMSPYFQVDALSELAEDITLVKRGVKRLKNLHIPQAAEFKRLSDLLQYDAVILADVPLWALGYHQLLMLEPYIRSGGRLLVLEGPCSGQAGGYADSLLENILPCAVGPAFATAKLEQPYGLPGLDDTESADACAGYLYYYKQQGALQKNATVLLSDGPSIILAERRLGHGRVVLFAGMPLGQDSDAQPGFWRSPQWPVYLKRILFP